MNMPPLSLLFFLSACMSSFRGFVVVVVVVVVVCVCVCVCVCVLPSFLSPFI